MKKRILCALLLLALTLTTCAPVREAWAASAPQGVTLDRTSVLIDLDSSKYLTLKAAVTPEDASQDVTWAVSNTAVATVNAKGRITAKKPGTAILTVRAKGTTVTQSIALTIVRASAPTSVTIAGDQPTIAIGKTLTLSASVAPDTASQLVKWTSSSSRVASVSASGVVTALRTGTVTIRAASAANTKIYASFKLKVTALPAPTSLTLSETARTVNIGERFTLTATASPADTSDAVTWKSSKSSIAAVSASGVVTARKAGTVTISAASKENSKVSAACVVTVVNPKAPTDIRFDTSEITVAPGNERQLAATVLPATAAGSVKWRSSSSRVASVSSKGVLKARKEGKAVITAYSSYNSSVKAVLTVNVVDASIPASIQLTAPAAGIAIGQTLALAAAPVPADASTAFTWKSSSTRRARVTQTGVVTGVSAGTVTITVTSKRKSSVKASVTLTVTDPKRPDAIQIVPAREQTTLEVAEKLSLGARVSPEGASQGVKWKTNSSVVAVSSTGVVTARRAGKATITAYSSYASDVKATYTVTVTAPAKPKSIASSPASIDLPIGQTQQINIVPNPANASKLYRYASSDASVVSVSDTGLLTARKSGDAVISVACVRWSAIKTQVRVKAYNPEFPYSLTLDAYSAVIGLGDTLTLKPTLLPATADQHVSWSSSNAKVVSVDGSGKLKGEGVGEAVITCQSHSGDLRATATITVLQTTLATTIPARTTDISGIALNLAKIEAIRRSAINEVLRLHAYGSISAAESSDRQTVINRAFAMQAFPWITDGVVEYWSRTYAEKRFLPDRVYYGLPYIQCGVTGQYVNRKYDAAKAVAQGYYASTGNGYYKITAKRLDGRYVGCDCSSFVSMAQFGTSHSASSLNTKGLAVSAYFKNVSNWANLRAGDLLVDSGHHTILFLYYVDAAKTRAMIIEQGGDGNTVICTISDMTRFSASGYIARRKTTYK